MKYIPNNIRDVCVDAEKYTIGVRPTAKIVGTKFLRFSRLGFYNCCGKPMAIVMVQYHHPEANLCHVHQTIYKRKYRVCQCVGCSMVEEFDRW